MVEEASESSGSSAAPLPLLLLAALLLEWPRTVAGATTGRVEGEGADGSGSAAAPLLEGGVGAALLERRAEVLEFFMEMMMMKVC